jgi:hypothetical protein
VSDRLLYYSVWGGRLARLKAALRDAEARASDQSARDVEYANIECWCARAEGTRQAQRCGRAGPARKAVDRIVVR